MDYTIKAVKASGSKDPHGNEWFSVLFESGEQASWLAKTEPRVGDTVYGNITEETKKSGEGTYKRFRKAQKDATVTGSNTPYKMGNEDPGRQDSIIRQSSMKAAVDLVTGGQEKYEKLFDLAEEIVNWVKNEKIEDKAKEVFPEAEEVKEENFMDDEVNLDDIPF